MIASCGLERFVRVFHSFNKKPLAKLYVKQMLTSIAIAECVPQALVTPEPTGEERKQQQGSVDDHPWEEDSSDGYGDSDNDEYTEDGEDEEGVEMDEGEEQEEEVSYDDVEKAQNVKSRRRGDAR